MSHSMPTQQHRQQAGAGKRKAICVLWADSFSGNNQVQESARVICTCCRQTAPLATSRCRQHSQDTWQQTGVIRQFSHLVALAGTRQVIAVRDAVLQCAAGNVLSSTLSRRVLTSCHAACPAACQRSQCCVVEAHVRATRTATEDGQVLTSGLL